MSAPGGRQLNILLGYDWIAGCLELDDIVTELPDEFFSELEVFRSLNKDLCVHRARADFFEESRSNSRLPLTNDDLEAEEETHQCIFCYRMNSRLFPVPRSSQECCVVCKKHKSTHPHTLAEAALVRVSVPGSRILPPYKYKIHRRSSFDPTDRCGLPSHCLLGQSYAARRTVPDSGNLDLRSNLKKKSHAGSQNKEMDRSEPKDSGNLHPDQIARLPRFNFKHFGPKEETLGHFTRSAVRKNKLVFKVPDIK